MEQLTVLYNGVCPVCRSGVCVFERRSLAARNSAQVRYVDVAANPSALADHSLSLNAVRFKLHAVTADGAVLRGWPAISALWRATHGWGWLARLGDQPGLNLLARAAYHVTAQALWWWNRACKRW